MDAWDVERLERIRPLLEEAVGGWRIPGAVAAAGEGEATAWQVAVGFAERDPYRERPMAIDTVFDLASVTKVTATVPLMLGLIEAGAVLLTDPVEHHIPEFQGPGKHLVTVGSLLTHTGGLRWHREFFRTLAGRDVVQAVIEEPLACEPGKRVVYSDLGFILLGEIASRTLGLPLEEAARQKVFEPLGMTDAGYLPRLDIAHRIAATEALPGRDGPKVGLVHDDNTEAMGGVAGHAGLFGTAADLARYAAMWLGVGPQILGPRMRTLATQCHTPAPWRRGLGWVLHGDAMDHTGDLWPTGTFGHTGYTGTSIAIDPESGRWLILLTNRVHFGRQVDISRLRRTVHNAAAGAWR